MKIVVDPLPPLPAKTPTCYLYRYVVKLEYPYTRGHSVCCREEAVMMVGAKGRLLS